MKLAIIGSGISGLVVAQRLQRDHELTLFEADDHLGGHAQTVDVELDGERHAVDTGFIVFNDWTYPHFVRLLNELGVESRPTTMSFSVRDDRCGLEYNGHSLNTLFAQRRNLLRPSFWRMTADILRFNRQARRLLETDGDEMTVARFLAQGGYSRAFAEHYLLPMGAAIWSCPTGTFADFPMRFIAEFYHNHGLINVLRRPTWRYIAGGSRTYVQAITRGFRERIRLRTPVTSMRRHADRMEVHTSGGEAESFDHVVFACHSDQALRLLAGDATAAEREILAAFPYGRNVAVLHTDDTLLPRSRRAWASWNYRIAGRQDAAPCVTYNMNLLQQIRSRRTICVTLNGEAHIAQEKILRRFEYHHPVFTTQRAAAQARHAELLLAKGASFCGAYWGNGFHEDGVASGLAVVAAIEARAARAAGRAPATAGVAS